MRYLVIALCAIAFACDTPTETKPEPVSDYVIYWHEHFAHALKLHPDGTWSLSFSRNGERHYSFGVWWAEGDELCSNAQSPAPGSEDLYPACGVEIAPNGDLWDPVGAFGFSGGVRWEQFDGRMPPGV